MQKAASTRAMTVPRTTMKGQKWTGLQFLEIAAPFPKSVDYSSHSFAYKITQSIKTNHLYFGHSHLMRGDILSMECVPLLPAPLLSDFHTHTGLLSLRRTAFCL